MSRSNGSKSAASARASRDVLEDERLDREARLRRQERVPVLEGEGAADASALEEQGELEEADRRNVNPVAALLGTPKDAVRLPAQAT
jgi:hypothetical protein